MNRIVLSYIDGRYHRCMIVNCHDDCTTDVLMRKFRAKAVRMVRGASESSVINGNGSGTTRIWQDGPVRIVIQLRHGYED